MTGAHNLFRLYALVICDHAPAQRNVEDFDFVSAVPHSNRHTVGTATWKNHDSSSQQSVSILHCHVWLCLSNPNISSALWRQCKSKNTAHLPGYEYPVLLRGWGEAVVTNDWPVIYSPCPDPENFARGGPTVQRFFLKGGGGDQIPLYKRAIIGPPVKRHLNGVSLACR